MTNLDDDIKLIFYMVAFLITGGFFDPPSQQRIGTRGSPISRSRRTVTSIMYELGGYSRRYYRMSNDAFWYLHDQRGRVSCSWSHVVW